MNYYSAIKQNPVMGNNTDDLKKSLCGVKGTRHRRDDTMYFHLYEILEQDFIKKLIFDDRNHNNSP